MDPATLVVVVLVIVTALTFDFTNGFHDTANAMATSIATGALKPKTAVIAAGTLNLIGAFLSTEVAKTISGGIINEQQVTISAAFIFAGLVGAIIWNLITWLVGLPSSSSHALFGGLVGAVIVGAGVEGVNFAAVFTKVLIPALVSPVVAGLAAFCAVKLIFFVVRKMEEGQIESGFRHGQTVTACLVALSHGTNDAQKTMGIITLTLIAVGKACIQKFFGFNAAENYWLFVLGGRSTHIIHSGVRYFSFFSDAANFGGSMGLSMVVFSISALYYRTPWMKIYLLLVAAAACYGMLISGTRSALAVPFVGYTAFIMMSRNIKVIVMGVLLVIAAFVFLKFTSIGQGNALVRRARSAFNSEDPSFKVRLENQAKLREIMADKPFGAGLGHGGGKAKTFTPTAPLSQIPTDSWFVMIWVETGVVGILLHIGILLYILARGAYLVVFKLRNTQLRGFTAALTAGISGIVVMAYANEILGQIPTGAILYMSMGFIFLAPRFDRELSRKEILDKATAAQQPPLRENYE